MQLLHLCSKVSSPWRHFGSYCTVVLTPTQSTVKATGNYMYIAYPTMNMTSIQTVDMMHACPTLIKCPPPFHPCRPLHLAAALCKVPEIIDLLLDGGVEVDTKNNSLATPLSTACQANNPYAASRLIAKGVAVLLSHMYTQVYSLCL